MKKTVLVIDDDKGIRTGLSACLKQLGWSVLCAESPLDASLLYSHCDVVLSDWDMPFGGGQAVLNDAKIARKPVLIHTGNPESVPGWCSVAVKPSSVENLHNILSRKAND